jgi:hypothetical protein
MLRERGAERDAPGNDANEKAAGVAERNVRWIEADEGAERLDD